MKLMVYCFNKIYVMKVMHLIPHFLAPYGLGVLPALL